MSFLGELQRRNVFRVAVLYVVTSWLVLQVAETLLPVFEVPDWVLRGMVLLLLVLFLPVLLFSWVYEITPDGIRKEREVSPGESVTQLTARRLDVTVIALILIALGVLIADRTLLRDQITQNAEPQEFPSGLTEPSTTDKPSIAVLPFADLSPESDQEYFADGISEELLNILARNGRFDVAARTSSFAFKGRNQPIEQIAQTLGVDAVVEGSVRKAGNTLRITAQLVDAESGFHLWSENYDRELSNIFQMQDDIARSVVSAVASHFGQTEPLESEASKRTSYEPRLAAYEAYIEGQYYLEKRTIEGLLQAEALFQRAIVADPQFAAPYAALAVQRLVSVHGKNTFGNLSEEEATDAAEPLIERALELDPHLPLAHATHGLLLGNAEKYEQALAAFERALELNPNHLPALRWKGLFLDEIGRVNEAAAVMERAAELDPLSTLGIQNFVVAAMQLGEVKKARAAADRLLRVFPDEPLALIAAAIAYSDDLPKRHRLYKRAESIDPDSTYVRRQLSHLYISVGMGEIALRYADSAELRARALLSYGKRDEAIQLARRYQQEEPDNPDRAATLGRLLVWSGKPAEARPPLEKAALASGGFTGPLNAYGLVELAIARRSTGDTTAADSALQEAAELEKELQGRGQRDSATNWFSARVASQLGDEQGALGHLERVNAIIFPSVPLPVDLRDDPALEPLADNPAFEQLLATRERKRNAARTQIQEQLAAAEQQDGDMPSAN